MWACKVKSIFLNSILFCIYLILISATVFASTDVAPIKFDIKNAEIQARHISVLLSSKRVDFQKITHSINQLDMLLEDADECVSTTNTKINAIQNQMKRYFGQNSEPSKTVDSKYLEKRKKRLIEVAAQCRLFSIKTKETIEQFREKLLSTQQALTFSRGENLFSRMLALPSGVKKLRLPESNGNKFTDIFSVKILLWVLTILMIANLITSRSRQLLRKRWRKQKTTMILNMLLIFFGLFFALLYLFLPSFFRVERYNEIVKYIYLLSSLLFSSIFIIHFIFTFRLMPKILRSYTLESQILEKICLLALMIYFINKIGIAILELWQSSKDIISLYESAVLVVSLSITGSFSLFLIGKNKHIIKTNPKLSWLSQIVLTTIFLLLIFDFLGYHLLAINAEYILFSLLFILTIGALGYISINHLYQLCNYNPDYQRYFKQHFGYPNDPPYLELLLINFILKIALFISMSYLFAYLIGEVSYFIDKTLNYFFDGFHVAGLTIIPFQWLSGFFVFCVLSLLSRKVSTAINQSQQFDKAEEEKQVAFASISLYFGFALSVILGLLVAGFNFTSLAIIAGALSVGVGLGLQSIVNNFVCGIILLIEKPFKTGDRIKVDEIEGFVKKIRVRSTQILTPGKEDIIIPNSDFITHQVSNYMYQDTTWRVKCCVGVAYGSNVELVEKVMTDVALSHPEVMKKAPNEPSVFFQEFGNSALLFELWCPIKNVNKKYQVKSELNFALDKAFRENNITIAFPQQDVHLKLDKTKLELISKKDNK